MAKFLNESNMIMASLKASRHKIAVFLVFVFLLVITIGSIMYVVEAGHEGGFSSIPQSIYWAIVTITTVGYGDIHPVTPVGQGLAACLMIMGYGVIAVPTGIVSAEAVKFTRVRHPKHLTTQVCISCSNEGHAHDAIFCKFCGEKLND